MVKLANTLFYTGRLWPVGQVISLPAELEVKLIVGGNAEACGSAAAVIPELIGKTGTEDSKVGTEDPKTKTDDTEDAGGQQTLGRSL